MAPTAHVITVSDRAFNGVYTDRSGPLAVDLLRDGGCEVDDASVVPDDLAAIQQAIRQTIAAGVRVVLTTGGTGVSPRDCTVEATRPLLTAELPGVAEAIRRLGADHTQKATLSRALAGVVVAGGQSAFVVNAPGSTGGVRDTIAVIVPLLEHVIDQLDGGDHEAPQP